jgi:hypothetical protein
LDRIGTQHVECAMLSAAVGRFALLRDGGMVPWVDGSGAALTAFRFNTFPDDVVYSCVSGTGLINVVKSRLYQVS